MKDLFLSLTKDQVSEILFHREEVVSKEAILALHNYFKKNPNLIPDPNFTICSYARRYLDGVYIPSLNKFICRNDQKGEGSNGEYFQLSESKGIKVPFDVRNSIKEFKKSYGYIKINNEFKNQKKLSKKHSFVVKAYELIPVYNTSLEGWTLGIVMEHITPDVIIADNNVESLNLKLGRKKVNFNSEKSLAEIINKEFEKSKSFHNDLHFGNVLVKNNQIKVIDFDSVVAA